MDQQHSRLGIASFSISMVFGLLCFVVVAIAGFVEASTPGGMDESSPVAVLIGVSLVGLIGLALVGVGLGVAGLFQPDRRKVFSVLGIVFSVTTIIALVALWVIGNSMD